MSTSIDLPLGDDLHVHLRQGPLMQMVTKQIRPGGIGRVLVMPNLIPPITTTDMAMEYKKKLQEIDSSVEYLMTLYLSQELTPEEVKKAHEHGVVGIKSYPKGVTTNSDSGIENYEIYYQVFQVMESLDMVLNLHGEIPSDQKGVCIMNAEEKFLPELEKIHNNFPNLRIVLEHVTTAAGVAMVKKLGPSVAATITVHHLELIIDDVAGKNHHFCKPVAKYPHDREALRSVVKEGHPKFFLGSDSAPHPKNKKESAVAPAGVFTTPFIMPYLASIFERFDCLDKLETFACTNGRRFYKLKEQKERIKIVRGSLVVPNEFSFSEGLIVPFLAEKDLSWKISH